MKIEAERLQTGAVMEFHHYVATTGVKYWDTVPKSRYHITLIGKYMVYEKSWEGYHDFGRLYWYVADFLTLEEAQQYVIENLEKKPDIPEEPGVDPKDLDEIVDRMMTDSSFHDNIVGSF